MSSMLQSDFIPEHEYYGELIDVSASRWLIELWCFGWGTDISYTGFGMDKVRYALG